MQNIESGNYYRRKRVAQGSGVDDGDSKDVRKVRKVTVNTEECSNNPFFCRVTRATTARQTRQAIKGFLSRLSTTKTFLEL